MSDVTRRMLAGAGLFLGSLWACSVIQHLLPGGANALAFATFLTMVAGCVAGVWIFIDACRR